MDKVFFKPTNICFFQLQYTDTYEEQKGKGSFPALITPAYQIAKKASQLSSNVS